MTEETIEIAKLFSVMAGQMNFYEAEVWKFKDLCRKTVAASDNKLIQESIVNQKISWTRMLESMCDAAAHAISIAKTGSEEGCVANLKIITEQNYKVVAHSHRTSRMRRSFDLSREKPVMENIIYASMLEKKGCYVVGDIQQEIDRARSDSQYNEPTDEQAALYKSCLVSPIYLDPKKANIVGIFCVDSRKKGYFDASNDCFDKLIVQQIVDHASCAFMTYSQAAQLQNRIQLLDC